MPCNKNILKENDMHKEARSNFHVYGKKGRLIQFFKFLKVRLFESSSEKLD
ncbi:MAG TPA: hypothetical protein VEV44_15410 [Pseudoneobacillus sp.]|nr:hypothetical protein [Pseudoneobacillus sp.]